MSHCAARHARPDPSHAPPPPRRLFVGNIPKTYTRCELMAIFSVCGCIIELRLHSDRATRASHGSACASHGSAFLW